MLRGFRARKATYAKVTVANSRAVWRAFRAGPVRAETSQKNPPSQIPANAVRSPVATSASSTTPVAPQRNAPRRPAHPQMPKAAELKKEATKRGFPRLPALRILPGAETPPKSQGRSKPNHPTRTTKLNTSEETAIAPSNDSALLWSCRIAAATTTAEPTSASGRQPTAHPRATSVAISRAAIHPARQSRKRMRGKWAPVEPPSELDTESRPNQQAKAPKASNVPPFAAAKGEASSGQTASTTAGIEARKIARQIRSAWRREGIYRDFGPETKLEETGVSSV